METSIRRTVAADGTTTVTVRGEIDYAHADELAACFREVVTVDTPSLVRVDLHGATFIDSTGLGALIEGYRAATENGARFVVVDPHPSFRRVLLVTGLSDLFGVTQAGAADQVAGQTQATGA
jgi:anti-sigma B factor antagonist